MTKARELADFGQAVTVVDNKINIDRTIEVPGLLDSSQVLLISTDWNQIQLLKI